MTNSHSLTASAPLLLRLGRLVTAWRERRQGWENYGRMSDRDVRDTGLSRWDIERELARPFWHG
ncbi:MAG: hypothetical protein JSS43_15490 [Proteobacteria bacterium]|nr:hypothetical protein [Pseudomonadota bacterium]